jgi:hypothetical protein
MTAVTSTPPSRPGWGPARRRGAAAFAVELADPGTPPGAVAALLDLFDRRAVASTWFLAPGTDPALLDRLWFTGHEAAALVEELDGLAEAQALASHGTPVVGALIRDHGSRSPAGVAAAAARDRLLTHVSLSAAGDVSTGDPVLAIVGTVVVLGLGARPDLVADPDAWLAAAQIGLGRAVQHGSAAPLRIDPLGLDRSGAFAAVVEAVDLAAGLVRAERLHVDRLDRLAAEIVGRPGFSSEA